MSSFRAQLRLGGHPTQVSYLILPFGYKLSLNIMWHLLLLVHAVQCQDNFLRYTDKRFPTTFQLSVHDYVRGGMMACWSKCLQSHNNTNAASYCRSSVSYVVVIVVVVLYSATQTLFKNP